MVPDNQPVLPIKFFEYPDESDLDGGTYPNGLYPIPPNLPIEGWPVETGGLTNLAWQQDLKAIGGDLTTTASFSVPGSYTLMLSAEDKIHGTAYDASVITVTP